MTLNELIECINENNDIRCINPKSLWVSFKHRFSEFHSEDAHTKFSLTYVLRNLDNFESYEYELKTLEIPKDKIVNMEMDIDKLEITYKD